MTDRIINLAQWDRPLNHYYKEGRGETDLSISVTWKQWNTKHKH